MTLFLVVYGVFACSLLLTGICSAYVDDEAEDRQAGAIVALTSFVWPVWIFIGLWIFICYLFRTALGKD